MGTDIHGVWQKKIAGKWEDIESEYEQNRHYLLFAWIGGVRNGYGFAGVPTHTPITPLSECRGFPDDFEVDEDRHKISRTEIRDPQSQKFYADIDADPEAEEDGRLSIWMGDHSHSWISVDEVISAKPPLITRTGIITIDQFKSWDHKTAPDSYCVGIDGLDIVVSDPGLVSDKTTHVNISWEEDTSETLKYFINECKRLKDLHGEVRFVFGFDS